MSKRIAVLFIVLVLVAFAFMSYDSYQDKQYILKLEKVNYHLGTNLITTEAQKSRLEKWVVLLDLQLKVQTLENELLKERCSSEEMSAPLPAFALGN